MSLLLGRDLCPCLFWLAGGLSGTTVGLEAIH